MLATSGIEGTAAPWDTSPAKQIGAPLPGPLPGRSPPMGMAAFDPTGRTLANAFQDGTVVPWDVDPASWLERACTIAGRNLTRQE